MQDSGQVCETSLEQGSGPREQDALQRHHLHLGLSHKWSAIMVGAIGVVVDEGDQGSGYIGQW